MNEIIRKFGEIDAEESDESGKRGEKRKAVEDLTMSSEESSDSDEGPAKKGKGKAQPKATVKGKGKKRTKVSRKEGAIVSKPQAATKPAEPTLAATTVATADPAAATTTKRRRVAQPTGKSHDPPCSRCKLGSRECMKDATGGSCMHCKKMKYKCEYALPRTTKKKISKPIIGSEDDQMDAPA
jgi:hypothetical protein